MLDRLYAADFPGGPVFAVAHAAVFAAALWETGDLVASTLAAILTGWIVGAGLGAVYVLAFLALTALLTASEAFLSGCRAIARARRRTGPGDP